MNQFKRKKQLNNSINSLRDTTAIGIVGDLVQLTTSDGAPVKGNFNQDLYTLDLTNPKTGEVQKYWADAGLRGSLKMAKVVAGMLVEIVHTGTKEIEQGTVQTYDIFELEDSGAAVRSA